MWELDYKESWAPKNWCFWTVVLEKTLESPLDCKEIQPVNPKGNQSQIFIGRTGAEAETPVLWPPHVKSWLIGKDSDAGRDWGQEEKGTTEDEMAGWHHWLDGHESEWTPGVSDGQGGLVCCDSWGRKELDMAEWLNWLTTTWVDFNYAGIGCRNLQFCWQKMVDSVVNELWKHTASAAQACSPCWGSSRCIRSLTDTLKVRGPWKGQVMVSAQPWLTGAAYKGEWPTKAQGEVKATEAWVCPTPTDRPAGYEACSSKCLG